MVGDAREARSACPVTSPSSPAWDTIPGRDIGQAPRAGGRCGEMGEETVSPDDLNALSPLSIEDRLEIMQAVGAVLLMLDLHEWDKVGPYLADEVIVDYRSIFGGEVAHHTRASLVELWRSRIPGFDSTQHQVTNVIVEGVGSRASTTSSIRACHRLGDGYWNFGGGYFHELVRTAEGWQIRAMTIRMTYEEGDRGIRAQALARMEQ